MYLSKLKIFGFKSFAQKVEVHFPGNGLTAVVGPNGCGKSNIVDAIRWVMGEQRASQLRSSKMQDVIFSGTEDRPAMNMAEVSLIINNDKGLLSSEFSEIQITRRAYRNGDSEYRLNQQECRLRDIHNLFLDTGMGAASYSLMEQKMIDAILSDRAEDRRVLFEEAAGVSKYKQQRKETIRQLDRVRLDMERLEDNLRHVRQSVRMHEKQVARAEEWKTLNDRLKALDLSMSLDKYLEQKEHLKLFAEGRQRLEDERNQLQTRLTSLEALIAEKKLSIAADEENYRDLEREVQDYHQRVSTLDADRRVMQGKVQSLQQNEERFQQEVDRAQESLLQLDRRQEEVLSAIEGLDEDTPNLEQELDALNEKAQVMRERVEDYRQQARDLAQRHRSVMETVGRLRSRWERVDAEMEQVDSQLFYAQQELESLEQQLQSLQQNETDQELDQLEKKGAELQERIQVLQTRRTDLSEALRDAREKEKAADAQRIGLQSRLDVLLQLQASGEGLDEGNRWILEHRREKIRDLLSEQIQVKAHTQWVERALGEAIQCLGIQDQNEVKELLQDLNLHETGRVALAVALDSAGLPELPALPSHSGIQGRLLDAVEAPAAWQGLIQRLLGHWVLVDHLDTALELAQTCRGDFWFCTPEGVVVHTSGMIQAGGEAQESGLLERRQQIESLQAQVIELEHLCQQRVEHCRSLENQADEADENLLALRTQLAETVRQKQELQGALQVAAARRESLQSQKERLLLSLQQLQQRQQQLQQEREADSELQKAETELEEIQNQLEDVNNRLQEEEAQSRYAEEELRELKAKDQHNRSSLQQAHQEQRSLQEQGLLHQNVVQSRSEDLEACRAQQTELQSQLETLADQFEVLHEALQQIEERRDAAKEKYDVLAGDLDEWNDEVRSIHGDLRDKDAQIHDVQRRLDALQINQDRLKERIFETWEVNLEAPGDVERVDYDEQDSPREMRNLKDQLRKIGPVNASVMEDFEAEKKRLEDVENQFDDLDRARASLERTIEKLDRIARERFVEIFRQIQRNFQDVFSSLMVGGEGRLTLQADVDPLEAEIEVNARPTGKKMRGVKALSGGERALTATSLLFALYMVKPSPYCILDEVDGPLDDANIGRFVQLLRRFSRQTQFIIVTHNKRTMAACDMLYGVTQEVKGISRIASVQLDEAAGLVN